MNYNYTACCWFPTSTNILILPSQFWQIRFESCWLHCSKCRILVFLRYIPLTFANCLAWLLRDGLLLEGVITELFAKWQGAFEVLHELLFSKPFCNNDRPIWYMILVLPLQKSMNVNPTRVRMVAPVRTWSGDTSASALTAIQESTAS